MRKMNRIQHLEEQISQLKKQINEVLSSPYPYTIDTVDIETYGGEVSASFTSAGGEYMYTMLLSPMFLNKDIALIGEVIFADEEGEVKLTGKGDAFRVLATAIELTRKIATDKSIIEKYIKALSSKFPDAKISTSIEIIKFSADTEEPSRVKLYDRIARNLPGFSLIAKEEGDFVLISNKTPARRKQKIRDEIARHGL